MAEIDVFIVGGGPAGLAAAIAVRRAGLRVVVADGDRPPIDKPCGEGLLPDSRVLAARLGVTLSEADGYEFRGIRFRGAERSVEGDFASGRGIGVRRTVLHRKLIEAAERTGVEFRWESPISDFDRHRDLKNARWVIGADGSSSLIRRWAGLDAVASRSRRYAYRRHFAVSRDFMNEGGTRYMEVWWGDGCQVYITPVDAREVCVALVSRRPDLRLDEALDRYFPALRERLPRALESSRERGSVTGNVTLRAVARGNVALIGDASGSVDAIAGEGICLGFRQAEDLAQALVNGDLSIYTRRHRWISLRPHLMAKMMLQLDRGALVQNAVISALASQPWMFRKLLEAHAG